MHRGRILGSGEHALGFEPVAEAGYVEWRVLRADGTGGLVPGRQDFPGARVEIAAGDLVPNRQ
jgi:hypothetical protein